MADTDTDSEEEQQKQEKQNQEDNESFDPKVLYNDDKFKDYSHFFQVDVSFDTREELIKWAKDTAVSHCHRVICQSSSHVSQFLTCHRYGRGRAKNIDVENPRNTGTKKCMCPFKLTGKLKRRDGKWHMRVTDGYHNHAPLSFPHGQGTSSRLTAEQYEVMKVLRNSHVKPTLIMDRLRKDNPDTTSSMRHIYNGLQKIRKEKMEGRTPIQQLIHNLTEKDYRYWHRQDADTGSMIVDIMFAHPDSVKLLRYGMPLLEIIGVTSVGRNFTIAVAFMSREDAGSYQWVLTCLREILEGVEPDVILTNRELGLLKALPLVFPQSYHILCLFHINRNVEENATKLMGGNIEHGLQFRRGKWAQLVNSTTIEEYQHNYDEMIRRYAGYPRLIEYVNDTWLIYKEKFVKAWTNDVTHFGNTTTNRVESTHNSVKKWLNSSTGGIDTVHCKLHSQVDNQVNELNVLYSLSQKIRKHIAAYPFLCGLLCYVTHDALALLDSRSKMLYSRN